MHVMAEDALFIEVSSEALCFPGFFMENFGNFEGFLIINGNDYNYC